MEKTMLDTSSSLISSPTSFASSKPSKSALKSDVEPNTTFGKDDPELANWEKWLSVHRRTQELLSSKVERSPRCLLMNSGLSRLYVNQEKRAFAEAGELQHCDKFRGHPNFWRTDDSFKPDGSLGVYQPLHRKYDRSSGRQVTDQCPEIRTTEYVGVPDTIFKEKGLSGEPCLPTPKDKWEQSVYVHLKRVVLNDKLKVIQEHKPELSEVAVVGKAVSKLKEKVRINESVDKGYQHTMSSSSTYTMISGTKTLEFTPSNASRHLCVSVYVDGCEVIKDDQPWVIDFQQECYVNDTYKKTLTIANDQNDACLRYFWDTVVPDWADCELPVRHLKHCSKCFFFDKRDGVILPNYKKQFEIELNTSVAGVFRETWQLWLSLSPDQWDAFTVVLVAVGVERPNCTENLDAIDAYVESCTRLTVARATVEEILQRARPQPPPPLPYDWKFFEEQIFIHNNPDLFYDNKRVYRLKNLHDELCLGPWDYSAKNLREELLKLPLGEDSRVKIEAFTKIVYELMKPSLSTAVWSEKHKTVYELLCCFVNKMDAESRNLKIAIGIPVVRLSAETELHESEAEPSFNTKISLRKSQLSKISSGKRYVKTSKTSRMNSEPSKTVGSGDSLLTGVSSGSGYGGGRKEKQEYLDAFYIKTYTLLAQTVDHISAFMESFEAQQKRTGLNSFKLARPYAVSKP